MYSTKYTYKITVFKMNNYRIILTARISNILRVQWAQNGKGYYDF